MGSKLLAIAGAGAVGALFRFGLSNGIHRLVGRDFPYGTLLVNVVGSLLVGYLFVILLERSIATEALRLAVLVGLLGSFTTFSTFSLETINLISHGAHLKATLNITLNVLLCLAATWIGIVLARML